MIEGSPEHTTLRVSKLESAFVGIQEKIHHIEKQHDALFLMQQELQIMQKDIVIMKKEAGEIMKTTQDINVNLTSLNRKMDGMVAAVNLLPSLVR